MLSFRRVSPSVPMLVAALVVFGLPGCSGGGALPAAHVRPSWWRAAPPTASLDVYVTEIDGAGQGTLFDFGPQNKRDRPARCTMKPPAFVIGIGADASGDVYLPDIPEETLIDVYAPHCGKQIATMTDRFGAPIGIAKAGSTIFVQDGVGVDVCTLSSCTTHLSDPSIGQLTGSAVDAAGDVWGVGYGSSGISLVVWRHAHMPGHAFAGFTKSGSAGDIMVDDRGRVVEVETHFSQAYVFACDLETFACSRQRTVTLHGTSNFASMNGAQTDVQITDSEYDSVDVYAYPSFAYEYSYDAGLHQGYTPSGIAQVP